MAELWRLEPEQREALETYEGKRLTAISEADAATNHYGFLVRLTSDDPATRNAALDEDPLQAEARGEITEGQRKEQQAAQKAIREGDLDTFAGIQTPPQIVSAAVDELFGWWPSKTEEQAKAKAAAERDFRGKVDALFRQEKKEAGVSALPTEKIQEIVGLLSADVVLPPAKEPPFAFTPLGRVVSAMFMGEDEVTGGVYQIPERDLMAIRAALIQEGIPVTPFSVSQAYQAQQAADG